jgi:hypothetical protein
MYFCFADESGDINPSNPKSRFFLICGMLIDEKHLLGFEKKVAELALNFNLRKKINLKSVQRHRYEYKPFTRLSESKRKKFWSELFRIFFDCEIDLVASILDKWSFIKKYKPKVREDILSRTYMHFLEKSDQIINERNDFQIMIFDETPKKVEIRKKHFWWINHDTPIKQEINSTYWAPFFIREEESHLLQMAHNCAYNLNFLFNKNKIDYFKIIKDSFAKYRTLRGERIAIKIFPDVGEKNILYQWKDFEICYWNYTGHDLRSLEEIQKMENFKWPPAL